MTTTTMDFDADALIKLFAEATARQGEALRQAVSEATLGALRGRELSLQNVGKALQTVTEAASAGAARNPAAVDVEALLGKAFAGMDEAMITAVEAHRKALQQLVAQGADFSETRLKTALDEVGKMEDAFIAAVTGAAQGAAGPLQGPWTKVIETMRLHGTGTGAHAAQTVEQLMSQARSVLHDSREQGLRTVQTLLDGYSALASGVLIGLVEGMRQQVPPPPPAPSRPAAETASAGAARRRKQ